MGLLAGKTLADAVAPGDAHLTITPPLALGDNPAGQPIQIGSELMMVTGGKRGVVGLARAADSAHTQGAAITELNPFVAAAPEGAGGVTVDNQSDPPAEVTTIIAPGALIDGAEATLPGILLTGAETGPGSFFRGPDDPADTPAYLAILEAGDQWTQTGGDLEPPYPVWQRNVANDGWEVTGQIFVDGTGAIRAVNKIQADGVIILEVRDTDGIAVISTLRIEETGIVKLYAAGVGGTGPAIELDPATGDVDIGGGDGGVVNLNGWGGAPVMANGGIVGTQAAFVANGSTVDELRDALIATGLMAAS